MNYEEARSQIRSGDLIALSHEEFDSWYDLQVQGVRFFTESEFSHVAIAWVIGGPVFVIESVVPDIRIVPLSNMSREKGFYWIPTSSPMTDAELEFALSKVGKGKYSKWQAILAQFRRLKIGADNLWECAEFVIAARAKSGVNLGDKATPSAVVRAAQNSGAPVYYVQL